jgi:hypothetical protein
MTGITRRFAIPLGLAALAPRSTRAGGECQQERRRAQDRSSPCKPQRVDIEVAIINYFEDQNINQITLNPLEGGSPQVFTPRAFGEVLSASMVANNDVELCGSS